MITASYQTSRIIDYSCRIRPTYHAVVRERSEYLWSIVVRNMFGAGLERQQLQCHFLQTTEELEAENETIKILGLGLRRRCRR
jgi:hypothetical protein